MNFKELVLKRESVRYYDFQKKVSKELIIDILETAHFAPSAVNSQPWEILIFSEGEKLNEIKSCYKRDWLQTAPVVIAVKGDKTKSWTRKIDGYNSIETDLAILMDHIILAATEKGLGTCWIANYIPEKLSAVLELKSNETIFAITPLGYPSRNYISHQKKRKHLNEIAFIIK
jgi:nitroreductase